jgi:D-cysteine desulfhydrase
MTLVELPPRLDLAQLPTAVLRLDRTTAEWGGPRLWIKRDDDTGGVLTGNKIRKLQYVVREALDQGAETLITCGGLQSNHCRATAAVGRRLGLEVILFLRGSEPERAEGNYLLDRVLGADVRLITPDQYERVDALMADIVDQHDRQGRRAFAIPEGASMATGAWGYIEACAEIAAAQSELGVEFDAIVAAVGSGGTAAGLEIGARLFGLSAKVWGINVCDDERYFRDKIHRIASETIKKYELDVQLRPEDIGLIDGYVGRGYAQSTPDELAHLVEFARREGIVLDPVYTGKALFGLAQEITGPRFADAQNVLFIHTGGVFGLFPKQAELPL